VLDVAEYAAFWKSVVNYVLLKADQFDFEQLVSVAFTLDKIGF
jgi:hypothetical protein